MKDWKHATQQEVDAMTFDEVHKIAQLQINKGIILRINDEDYIDEIGGFHSPCNCSNPNGYYCGDCTKLTCKDCECKELRPV